MSSSKRLIFWITTKSCTSNEPVHQKSRCRTKGLDGEHIGQMALDCFNENLLVQQQADLAARAKFGVEESTVEKRRAETNYKLYTFEGCTSEIPHQMCTGFRVEL